MQKQTRRVLIIDDDFDNLQLTKDILQFNGFETYDFISPRLGQDAFRQKPQSYDMIPDIKMEEMDGRLVFKEMKRIKPNAQIFVFSGL